MAELAPLYEAMGALGFSPRDVDDMELWECAAMLGQLHPPAEAEDPEAGKPQFDQLEAHKARVRAREAGLPAPMPPPPSTVRLSPAATVAPTPAEQKGA